MAKKRTWAWPLAIFVAFLLVFAGLAWTLNRWLLGRAPAVRPRTVLELTLRGPVGEIRGTPGLAAPLTVREIDEALRRAARDDRVTALLVQVGAATAGFAKAQEIREAVRRFRESGKPALALVEFGTSLDLYLAAPAATIYQVPTGDLFLGFLAREPFYRELLHRLGVEFDVFHTGPYKTAMHSLTRSEMPPEQRRMIEDLLDELYGQWTADVAADRGLPPEELRVAVDRGLLAAAEARQRGLVDELAYRPAILDRLEELAGGRVHLLGVREYLRATGPGALGRLLTRPAAVALVHVSGLLVPGEAEPGLFGGDLSGADTVAGYLRRAREDDEVRAIVLRVDSPGGAVTAADVIWREARLAAEAKPLVVSMSDVAASGGYWIATAATRVLADPATYTGSIGVILGRVNLARTYEMLGIRHELIKRGDNADLFTETQPLRPDQAALLEDRVEEVYRTFVARVAEGRGLSVEEVEAVAQGRVWTGTQALARGLVDGLGGLRAALEAAREEAGIGPREPLALKIYPPTRSLLVELSRLLGGALGQRDDRLALPYLEVLLPLRAAGPVWALVDLPLPAAAP